LGIETLGGVLTRLIERNTTIPTRKSEVFSTAADSQTSVEIHVLQGEREMARDNRTLGKFHLVGIPPAPRGIPQIEVTFDIDANGIVSVSAKDRATGKEQKITITASSGLSQDDIKNMVRDAETHSSEDKKRREEIDLRNKADSQAYGIEKMLKENEAAIDASDKTAIQAAIADVRKALEGDNVELIKTKVDALEAASHKLAEAMYRKASEQQGGPSQGPAGGAQGGQTGDPGKSPGGDDVIDAEIVDEN
jgi:molecular chaperone DnaK